MRRSFIVVLVFLTTTRCFAADQAAPNPASHLENAFASGWILQDSNNDGINDVVRVQILVSGHPAAAANAAAANIAARLGYETSGLTLPIVFTANAVSAEHPQAASPKIWVGTDALTPDLTRQLPDIAMHLGAGEGGWFVLGDNLAVVGNDPVGLLSAASAYAARAPYQWTVPGDKVDDIVKTVNAALEKQHAGAMVELAGLTYLEGQAGIRRAVLRVSGSASPADVRRALTEAEPPVRIAAVHELYFLTAQGTPFSVSNSNPFAQGLLPAMPEPAGEESRLLDLGTLYGIKGLLGGSPKKPIPSSVMSHLYVPSGQAGVAMANLAARIGLETSGITLPLAFVAEGISPGQVHSAAVIAGSSLLSNHAESLLAAAPGSDLDKADIPQPGSKHDATMLPALAPGEGEIRVVDNAFGKNGALLARGNEQGAAAALCYAGEHLPSLWDVGKQYESIEEILYGLHRFFSLRSGAGQATAALVHIDRWLQPLKGDRLAAVEAEIYADKADPELPNFVRKAIAERVKADHVSVRVSSLHAGLKCCANDPPLHYQGPDQAFHPAKPTFEEDLTIPWEGKRLLEAVQAVLPQIKRGDAISLEARVSEGPQMRQKLTAQIRQILQDAGADPKSQIVVLSAYKQGYGWILDEVAPELAKASPARVVIEFAPYRDKNHMSAMDSKSRWVQELYPVDEMLAKQIGLPLEKIELAKMSSDSGPTYRVMAYGSDGKELYRQDFTVAIATRPYSPTFPNYDNVTVETGWIKVRDGERTLADQRIVTDIEQFWDHYQNETLPRIYKLILSQNNGKPRQEFQPLFDTLKISVYMSEPDYNIGLDQERISSLEALQEDTLFSTENFFDMLGNSESNGIMDYQGRVIPVVHPSREGQDGQVKIEFYGKDASNPLVRLRWKTSANAPWEERERDLPALAMSSPRLVAARVKAGQPGVESLTWRLLADARQDEFEQWRKVARQEQVERTMFSAEQGQAQVRWLEAMHSAGVYRDALNYPHLAALVMEFELPQELGAPEHSKPEIVPVQWAVQEPARKRPMIGDIVPTPVRADGKFVSWDQPIGPGENEHLLARLAKYPGVNVYWMGRSYLGQNIWAADIMLPSPSRLRSMAKETTLKAAVVYSGRQHANEVSSTSHILRLAEQLVTEDSTRAMLKKVNVVIHPITNPDGAALAMELGEITPDNMLHPGYHASLTADVVTGQWEADPIYPESRTRRLLWEAWLPDAFLNPHGYPSHEWVQPFSEYAGWVINRYGADSGRAWWISRGWFTSLNYLRDEDHPHSRDVAYSLRERIAAAMANAPGVLDMNRRMNSRYERFGQHWDADNFQQAIFHDVRVYMALKGEKPDPRSPSFLARFPDVTWDDGYTEAPDETARGQWLHLVASAGLAFDRVHLEYLADSEFKIKRTQRELFNGVQWKVDRDRPVLPRAEPPTVASGSQRRER